MEKDVLNKFREDLIRELEVYPRVVFYVLRESDFKKAKLFFGEEVYRVRTVRYSNATINEDIYFWQYHMSKMVLSSLDPISYMREFACNNK